MTASPPSRHAPRLATAILVLPLAACHSWEAPDPSRIRQADVERVIDVLASDSMRGRRAFTDDALRAADFLAAEFRAAGLEPLEGADGFLQHFAVQSLTPESISLTLGGEPIASDRVAFRPGASSVRWTTGDAELHIVGAEDDPGEVASLARRGGEDLLILLHPVHAELFGRLRSSVQRPARIIEGAPTASVVMALAEASPDVEYRIDAEARVAADTLANVVGRVPGRRPNERVLFSAHYDHIGVRPAQGGDSIANGANDDASGTAAVVELARYFAARGTPERTLLFAAFTAEEAGGYGSRYFSSRLDPDQIVAMFNIEMIGKPAVSGPNTAWITGFERSSFGSLLQEAVEGTDYRFYADPYPTENLFYRSDNATLARLGVPAHSISTTPIDVDPDYHRVTDEVSTLDLDHLSNTVRAIALGAERIVTGEATPTRVDPSTVN